MFAVFVLIIFSVSFLSPPFRLMRVYFQQNFQQKLSHGLETEGTGANASSLRRQHSHGIPDHLPNKLPTGSRQRTDALVYKNTISFPCCSLASIFTPEFSIHRWLFSEQIGPQARDKELARTPLHFASRSGGLETTLVLLNNGAALNAKTGRQFGRFPGPQ